VGQDRAWVDNVRFTPDNVPVDSDGDGVLDQFDNCPLTFNPNQFDNDVDGFGDVCDPDDDNDGVLDSNDNCQFDSNASQANFDFDSMGDVCDPDDDNDGYTDVEEINAGTNPLDPVSNPLDSDGDGVFNFQDNCPSHANPAQYDRDFDQQGNICDPQPGPPGSIFVWGSDDPGVFQVSATPSSSDFIAIAGGGGHSLALTAQGQIVGWGFDGNGQISGRPTGSGHTQIASGSGFGLALTSGGAIVAWGDNTYGQVSGKPGGTGFVAISAFGYEAAALRADGSIVAWGRNQYGHVGSAPTGTGFVAVDVGGRQSVALTSAGQIVTWGDNTFNQISGTPTGTGYSAVSSGFAHVLALTSSGAIVSWGSENYGLPNVPGGTGYSAISAGNGHSSALTFNGSLVEWGGVFPLWADFRLFDPPVASGFTAISEGQYHVVALYDAAPPPCDDGDGDGVCYPPDNCPLNYNPLQQDTEQDGLGDVCDPDDDNDGISDLQDNCQFDFNPSQGNFDFDPMGDICDPDDDNDGYTDIEEINAGSDPRDSNSTPIQSGPTLTQFNAAGGYAAYLANPSNVDLLLAGVCDEAQAFAHWRDFGFAQGRTFAPGKVRTDRLNGSLDPNYAIDGGFAWEYPGANTIVFITADAPKPPGWAGSALLLQRCQTFNIGSFYSAEIYRNINPDVRDAIDQGLVPSFQSVTDHYVKYGFKEGRLTNSDWTAAQLNAWSDPGYLAANPDVANYFQGAANAGWSLFGKYGFAHWINFGRYEGRNDGQTVVPPASRFEGCSDGLTVADNETGLLWEKKVGVPGLAVICGSGSCSNPRDVNNQYKWANPGEFSSGNLTDFLSRLNVLGSFAGYTDWRIPEISELQSIAIGEAVVTIPEGDDPLAGTNQTGQAATCSSGPCVDPDFAAIAGPTRSYVYWSATESTALFSNDAFMIHFGQGKLYANSKSYSWHVRAVRTGSCAP